MKNKREVISFIQNQFREDDRLQLLPYQVRFLELMLNSNKPILLRSRRNGKSV